MQTSRAYHHPSNNKATVMSYRFTIDALNELIAARRDAELGLRICAEHVREARLRALVWSHLQALVWSHLQICGQALQELQSLVRLLGGDRAASEEIPSGGDRAASEEIPSGGDRAASEEIPSGDDRAVSERTPRRGPARDSATVQRRWSDLRTALACDGDGVILDECERGGSRSLEIYRNALDDPLPDLVRAIVLRQFEEVMTNHDQIRDLRSEPSRRADSGAGSGAQAGQH